MKCYRAFSGGDSIEDRLVFTKSSGCNSVLDIGFLGVINVSNMTIKSIVTEVIFPDNDTHNHSLDQFSISASDTCPRLRAYIDGCVSNGMGHHNTFVQVRKFAREVLVPDVEKKIGKQISLGDTRFYPTRRTVYTYWLYAAGGSVKACEDQKKIQELLEKIDVNAMLGKEMYYNFEAFDPRLLSKVYGVALDKSFEELLSSKTNASSQQILNESESFVPVISDTYFANVDEHLRPRKDASAQQRYDIAVKLLIRECAMQNVRMRASVKPSTRTGAFYLFLQTKDMADMYRHFGHESVIFMDSGFRINRNAFPITFVSVLDNFMKGRMVGVMISQFTDERTYSKCLLELKRGNLNTIRPQCSMTDFDMAEISAFRKTWPDIVILICTFHAIAGQSKWVDKNVAKAHREKLKAILKELQFVENEDILKKKISSLKRYCTTKQLGNVKKYFKQSWEPFLALWVQFYRNSFWCGQSNTNNISEGRVGSFKKGLKNVTDGSIFSAVKYLLETYIPNDIQDFRTLNRNNAWENKKLVRLQRYPNLQNRPPGAVAAINNVFARAAEAVKKNRYRYRGLGAGRYCVTNTQNGHKYSFTLQKADCSCVDSVTNVYKIPCIHAVVLILRLKLDWKHFNLSVRRNVRNSLIKITDRGWQILGCPAASEDHMIDKFWEKLEVQAIQEVNEVDIEDSKEEILHYGGDGAENVLPHLDSNFEISISEQQDVELERLPTDKTARRLVKKEFQEIHDSAGRIRETLYNLLGALRVNQNQAKFVSEWMLKNNVLSAVKKKLLEAESMLMTATGAHDGCIPVVSNLDSVRALNKSMRDPQTERRPLAIREQRQERKRARAAANSILDTVQTPLIEAHRPGKKRKAEASRQKKNYAAAAKRTRVPKTVHSSIQQIWDGDDSAESTA